MPKPLEQLASSTRTTKTNVGVSGGAGYAPSKAGVRAENLAGDLLQFGSQLGKTIDTGNDLSVLAAERAAQLNLSEMAQDLATIDSQITPDTNLRDVQVANQAVFQHYANVERS